MAREDVQHASEEAISGSSPIRIISLFLRFGNVNVTTQFQRRDQFIADLISPRRRRVYGARRLRIGRGVFHVFPHGTATRRIERRNGTMALLSNYHRNCHSQATTRALTFMRSIARFLVRVFATIDHGISVFKVGFFRFVGVSVGALGAYPLRQEGRFGERDNLL